MSLLDTILPSIDLGTGETAPYSIDVTNVLGSGESLQTTPAPSITVTSVANNAVVSGVITAGPSVNGNIVTFTISGAALQPKQSYTLVLAYSTNSSGKRLQAKLNINCVI